MIALITSQAIPSRSYAGSCDSALYLKVGDTVKDCDRIGLSLDADKENRKQLMVGDINAKIVDEQKKLIDIKDLTLIDQDRQIDLWKGEAIREREYSDSVRSRGIYYVIGGVAVGVGLVALSAWVLNKATH